MANVKDVKRGSKRSSKKQRDRKQSRQPKATGKSTTRPSDVYEAEQIDPQEEVKAGQRYDVRDLCCLLLPHPDVADKLTVSLQRVDNYEYELPSDFEDEEIDEEAAFTEADKKQFADWFGDEAAAGRFCSVNLVATHICKLKPPTSSCSIAHYIQTMQQLLKTQVSMTSSTAGANRAMMKSSTQMTILRM